MNLEQYREAVRTQKCPLCKAASTKPCVRMSSPRNNPEVVEYVHDDRSLTWQSQCERVEGEWLSGETSFEEYRDDWAFLHPYAADKINAVLRQRERIDA